MGCMWHGTPWQSPIQPGKTKEGFLEEVVLGQRTELIQLKQVQISQQKDKQRDSLGRLKGGTQGKQPICIEEVTMSSETHLLTGRLWDSLGYPAVP